MSPEPREVRPRPLQEVALVFIALCVATALISRAPAFLPGLEAYVPLLIAGIFLFSTFRLARREIDGVERFGIDLAGLMLPPDPDDPRPPGPAGLYDLGRALRVALPSAIREGAVALGLAALIFPPFAIGFYFFHTPDHSFSAAFPDETLSFALTQILVVALPEEAFFRGYVQTRLQDLWPNKVNILGASLSAKAWVLQAGLFAVVHLIATPHPARLAVFFPGLLFGWLRARRGGIGAAILLHALSNILADFLERGWLL